MSDFLDAYRHMVIREVRCPKCGGTNLEHASPSIEIDQTGTKAFCTTCAGSGPIAEFLPKVPHALL